MRERKEKGGGGEENPQGKTKDSRSKTQQPTHRLEVLDLLRCESQDVVRRAGEGRKSRRA